MADKRAAGAHAGPLQLLVVSTACISQLRTEIRRLAYLASHILDLLAGARPRPLEVALEVGCTAPSSGYMSWSVRIWCLKLLAAHSKDLLAGARPQLWKLDAVRQPRDVQSGLQRSAKEA